MDEKQLKQLMDDLICSALQEHLELRKEYLVMNGQEEDIEMIEQSSNERQILDCIGLANLWLREQIKG